MQTIVSAAIAFFLIWGLCELIDKRFPPREPIVNLILGITAAIVTILAIEIAS